MSDAFRIRQYEPSDADRVWDVHEAAMRDADAYLDPATLPDGRDLDADLRNVGETYSDADGAAFLVGEVDGTVVGTGAFERVTEWPHAESVAPAESRVVKITRMRVVPDWQGEGLGERLLVELEERAAGWGAEVFVLDTLARLTAARGLYEGHGYRETGRETRGEWERLFYRKRVA